MWLEEKNQLVSYSKDKKVKVWQLPIVWYDEEQVKNKVKKEQKKEAQLKAEAAQKSAEKVPKLEVKK